jgi:hypothetical protein
MLRMVPGVEPAKAMYSTAAVECVSVCIKRTDEGLVRDFTVLCH